MDDIPCFYYESASLAQKYQWMHSGPGGSAAVGFGDGLAQLAADFNASDANIGRNLVQRRLGTEWQGQAATSATEALNRAATAIAANAAPGNTGRDSSHQYGDSFNATRNAIQLVPDAGANSWWGRQADAAGTALNDTFGSTFGVQSDYSQRLAAYRAADQVANDALYKHETTSRTVLAAYQGAITGQAAAPTTDRAGTGSDQAPHGGPPPSAHGGPVAGGPGAAGVTPTSAAGGSGPGSGSGRTDPTGTGPGGVAGAGRPGDGQTTEVPTTAPAGFTPLSPASGAPAGLQPGPTGGFVPAGPGAGSVPPPLPPLDGGFAGGPGNGGAGYGGAGYGGPAGGAAGYGGEGGYGGGRSPAPRGGAGALAEGAGRAPAGGYGSGGEVGRAGASAGPAGMPMGGGGAAAGEDREHHNTVFLPDDEPFRVDFDDVTGAVIGLPDEPR